MSRLTLLLCLFGLAWSQVSAVLDAEGVVGGKYAKEGDYKYQISLQIIGYSICGGCIIADNYVLTAAQCVTKETGQFDLAPYTVVAGTNNLNIMENAAEVPVDTIYIHKDFHPITAANDIAILKLKKGLGLSSNPHVEKINLPQTSNTYAGMTAIIAGFGMQNMNVGKNKFGQLVDLGGTADGKLKYADVKILSYEECVKKNTHEVAVFQTNICGQVIRLNINEHVGICTGDSGSPLVYGNDVIGIASRSPLGCDESRLAAPYTRVSLYVDLIKSVVNGTPSSEVISAKVPQ